MILLTEIKIVPQAVYNPGFGHFGVYQNGYMFWQGCRDSFQTYKIKEFYFRCRDVNNVINFIDVFESIVDLPETDQVTFGKTDKSILYVLLSDWWYQQIRKSLFTALLRCGDNFKTHTGKGFVKALKSLYYTRNTYKALQKFLNGFTHVKNDSVSSFKGWTSLFRNKSEEQISEILVKKKK